ncbi:MAG: TnsA endonuclease N-terminal domain-containing protein [Pseudomonadota bacterium]
MPIRTIPKNYRNVTGIGSSVKSEGDSAFESTLERDFYSLLQFDNNVHRYEVQPLEINYLLDGKQKTYTPDTLVQYVKSTGLSPTIFEVKYRSDLKENWAILKPKFKATIRYAKSVGWRFRLVTEHEIRTTYLKNVKFLLSFRKHPINDAHEALLLIRLAEMRETNPATLLLAVFRDKWSQAELIPSLWRLVSVGSIGADLNCQLTMSSRLWSKL